MRSAETERNAILAALAEGPLGVRELARRVGRRVQALSNDIERMNKQGIVTIARPTGGYRSGSERVISLVAKGVARG